jgi:hypothetical protein
MLPVVVRVVFLDSSDGVRLSPLGMSATFWPIAPAQVDRWWVWSSRWNDNWQGKPKYSEKTSPNSTFPPQIPHDPTWARTRAAALGSRRLTAWAMALPGFTSTHIYTYVDYKTIALDIFHCLGCVWCARKMDRFLPASVRWKDSPSSGTVDRARFDYNDDKMADHISLLYTEWYKPNEWFV